MASSAGALTSQLLQTSLHDSKLHSLSRAPTWQGAPRRPAPGTPAACPPVRAVAEKPMYMQEVPAPKGLFPPEPEKYEGPKLKVAIVGAGLAGMSTAVELLDQGHEVDIYEARPFIGGKVASFQDKDGNHIELGLHVFFGCYNNLFRLMNKTAASDNLLLKEHLHTFVNEGGDLRALDFRFPVGAPLHGLKAFFTTGQLSPIDKLGNSLALGTSPVVRALFDPDGAMQDIRNLDSVSFSEWFTSHGGTRESLTRLWDPIAYALGFIDCDHISARCMLTIFAFFATKTKASVLRMLCGSPDKFLSGPIADYIKAKGGRFHLRRPCLEVMYSTEEDGRELVTGLKLKKAGGSEIVTADAYVAALDIPGVQRLLPKEWRARHTQFDNIYKLEGVPVITVQLRYNGWITEMQDIERSRKLGGGKGVGLDNLLYSADADFSCFADLAITSPADYYKEGQGSLMQCVLTPADPYMPLSNDEIVGRVNEQVMSLFPSSLFPSGLLVGRVKEQVMNLFPSAEGLELIWSSVVKIAQSLYREAPGMDPFRPDQRTPVPNFYLAGSYTKQDYIDSMEGATLSGRQAAARILEDGYQLSAISTLLDGKRSLSNIAAMAAPSFV